MVGLSHLHWLINASTKDAFQMFICSPEFWAPGPSIPAPSVISLFWGCKGTLDSVCSKLNFGLFSWTFSSFFLVSRWDQPSEQMKKQPLQPPSLPQYLIHLQVLLNFTSYLSLQFFLLLSVHCYLYTYKVLTIS